MNKIIAMVVGVVALLMVGTHVGATAPDGSGPVDTSTPSYTCPVGELGTPVGCMPMDEHLHDEVNVVLPNDGTTVGDMWGTLLQWPVVATYGTPYNLYTVPQGAQVVYNDVVIADDESLHFNTATMAIYMSEDQKDAALYYGPAVLYYMMAHEYGHYIQVQQGMAMDPEGSAPVELQAYAIAGTFIKWAVDNGFLTDDDVSTLDIMLDLPDDGIHGTPEQRSAAFYSGYNDGLSATNQWVTNFTLFDS